MKCMAKRRRRSELIGVLGLIVAAIAVAVAIYFGLKG
jgi:hypothetical protein